MILSQSPQRFDATDPAAYPELAEAILNPDDHPRLLSVWKMTVYQEMNSVEIADVLECHPVTVRKDRAKAHLLMREAVNNHLADLSREELAEIGEERFGMTLQYGHHAKWRTDKTEKKGLKLCNFPRRSVANT